MGGIETGVQLLPRDKPGGYLFTALVVPGIEVARARIQALVWNVGTPRPDAAGCVLERLVKGRIPNGGSVRERVPMRGRRADRLVVVRKPV
jgi:hypothetical protein